jgi:hypothetical protein
MKKKIFIGLGLVLLAVVGFFGYGILFPKSPPTKASFSDQGLEIVVTYSQPSKRGRIIFGEQEDGALQPYGKYWRLGANAPTEITFSKNITFAGKPINAGTYRMYAVPGQTSFEIYLNTDTGGFSGAGEPDHTSDILNVTIPVVIMPAITEKFVITFEKEAEVINMDFAWDNVSVKVPITVQ